MRDDGAMRTGAYQPLHHPYKAIELYHHLGRFGETKQKQYASQHPEWVVNANKMGGFEFAIVAM